MSHSVHVLRDFEEEILLLRSLVLRRYSAVATLTLLLYEYFITFYDEFTFIWRKRNFNGVLCTYILSRYLAIFAQISTLILVFGPFSKPGISSKSCITWYIWQFGIACFLLAAIDFILMLRVYALYHKNTRIGLLLILTFFAMRVADCYITAKVVFDGLYNSICDNQEIHPTLPFYGLIVGTVHIGLGVLTAGRWRLLALGIPIAQVVTRDGAWVLGVRFAVYGLIIRHAMSVKVLTPDTSFMWAVPLFSIACCRMIMNMQTLRNVEAMEDGHNASVSVLTSDIDMTSP